MIDVFRVGYNEVGAKYHNYGETTIFQIGLKLSGKAEILYNHKKYNFDAKSVLYLPKEKISDVDYQTTIIEPGESVCIFFDSPSKLPTTPILIAQNDFQMYNMFYELNKAYNQKNEDLFTCMSIFFDILSKMNKKLNQSYISEENKMTDVILYMQNHVTDKYIDFAMLAAENNMSIDHFRHVFKKIYNISPLRYFNEIKMEYIKSLIRKREFSISDIAAMSGFDDTNYFSRFFKKHVGMSPSEYKNSCFI